MENASFITETWKLSEVNSMPSIKNMQKIQQSCVWCTCSMEGGVGGEGWGECKFRNTGCHHASEKKSILWRCQHKAFKISIVYKTSRKKKKTLQFLIWQAIMFTQENKPKLDNVILQRTLRTNHGHDTALSPKTKSVVRWKLIKF